MPGVIIHLIAAGILLIAIHSLHFKWEYSWAAFVGSFIPDVFKFSLTAVKLQTLDVPSVVVDPLYAIVHTLTNTPAYYFSLGFFFLGSAITLYNYKVINKKELMEIDELYLFLLVGVFLHLLLDVLVKESTFLI